MLASARYCARSDRIRNPPPTVASKKGRDLSLRDLNDCEAARCSVAPLSIGHAILTASKSIWEDRDPCQTILAYPSVAGDATWP